MMLVASPTITQGDTSNKASQAADTPSHDKWHFVGLRLGLAVWPRDHRGPQAIVIEMILQVVSHHLHYPDTDITSRKKCEEFGCEG